MNYNQYLKKLREKVEEDYVVAREARKKGMDPVSEVEIPVATSLAAKLP